jgi:hypothetical protein
MAGSKIIRALALVAFIGIGIQRSNAQDVHVFLAADHVRTFTKPYLSPSGGTLGLRFPGKRLAVELALSHAQTGSFRTKGVDQRTTYTAAVLYNIPWKESWNFELGLSAGYGSRYVSGIFTVDRPLIPMGAVLAIRYVRGQWMQPFFAIQPTYDHMLEEVFSYNTTETPDGVWGMSIRAGVSMALPSNNEQRGW